jgi:hypothetical protein
MKFRTSPKQCTSINLTCKAHGLARFLLVDSLESSITHCTIKVVFVMICLDFLKADNIWANIHNFSQDILESVAQQKELKLERHLQ